MIAACEGAKPESRETTINYVTSSTNGKLPTINENSKWFEPRSISSSCSVIVRVSVVLKRTVGDSD